MATPVHDGALPLPPEADPGVQGLVQGGRWESPPGQAAHVITYSFEVETEDLVQWTPEMSAAVREALAAWSAVANIQFVEVAPASDIDSSSADLAIALSSESGLGSLGFAGIGFFPDPAAFGPLHDESPRIEGDIYLSSLLAPYVSAGGFGRAVMVHEIGHALGLKHPDDDGLNDRPTFSSLGIGAKDNPDYTVMQQNAYAGTLTQGNEATPMMLDILAIQYLYGANTSYHAGNDTYTVVIGRRVTIWDAGGTDTLSMAGLSNGVWITLEAGQINTVDSLTVVGIAYGVQIENAIGGSGDDRMTGNALDNRLEGRGGADTLEGAAGADTLIGGAGNDLYFLQDTGDQVLESPSAGRDRIEVYGGWSGVLPANFEDVKLYLPTPADVLGNALANEIVGDANPNRLEGGAGNDTLDGYYAGPDTLVGGPGDDVYRVQPLDLLIENPGEGVDTWTGVAGTATFALPANFENATLSDSGDRTILGNDAPNRLVKSGLGADVLRGFGGDDTMQGGLGDDTYYVEQPGDVVIEPAGAGTDKVIFLTGGNYALGPNVERLDLLGHGFTATGNGSDNLIAGNGTGNVILGGAGNDSLSGGRGADTLDGGTGNDTLDGGRGADVLVGGAGNDLYVVDGSGDSIVELAGAGTDTVQVYASRYELPANVENAVVMSAVRTKISGNALANEISGGAGNDTLVGGAGADRFVFDEPLGSSNVDRLPDFAANADRIVLDDDVFGSGSVWGQNLLYVPLTGQLYYDADGGGAEEPVLFAIVGTRGARPELDAGDFAVVS